MNGKLKKRGRIVSLLFVPTKLPNEGCVKGSTQSKPHGSKRKISYNSPGIVDYIWGLFSSRVNIFIVPWNCFFVDYKSLLAKKKWSFPKDH